MPVSTSPERSGILAGGNWIIDHVKMVDRFPEQDTLASILDESRGTGGSPYNVLVDLAKLGARFPLEAAGLVGDDPDGRSILEDCRAFGIDASGMHSTPAAGTSYTDVMTVRGTGRRTFFHYRGANALLDEGRFDLAASRARVFHLGYLLLLDKLDELAADGTTGASRLLAQASSLGMRTSLDVVSEDSERFAAVVTPALPHVDYLVVNEFEAGRSSGVEVSVNGVVRFDRLAEAAGKLLEAGVREWVVIHCPEGALARHASGAGAVQGSVRVPPGEIAGAAGAGDAFAAGVLLGLHDDLPIERCLRFGVCAAASNLTDPTCTGGILPLDDCLRRGERLGFRVPDQAAGA
jgi:sugar/nucleoside kinase (ribokinase family)